MPCCITLRCECRHAKAPNLQARKLASRRTLPRKSYEHKLIYQHDVHDIHDAHDAQRLQILRRGYSTANRITWQLSSCRTCARQARHLISRRKQNKIWIESLFPRQLGLNMRGNPIVLIVKLLRRLGRDSRR